MFVALHFMKTLQCSAQSSDSVHTVVGTLSTWYSGGLITPAGSLHLMMQRHLVTCAIRFMSPLCTCVLGEGGVIPGWLDAASLAGHGFPVLRLFFVPGRLVGVVFGLGRKA